MCVRVGDFVPGFTPQTILTSGPPMTWPDYTGGQREAIIGGALFEGLAKDRNEAIAKLDAGEITVGGCHDFGCVGSLAGIYTASMPAFVVENRAFGNVACCNIYEGSNPRRLNYGVYDDGVRERLLLVQNEIVPVIAEALRQSDGIPLKPIIKRALGMGDELHSRNTRGGAAVPARARAELSGAGDLRQRENRSRGQGHDRRSLFLPASLHGGGQGHRRRGARHRGLERRHRHGLQLPRLRHCA